MEIILDKWVLNMEELILVSPSKKHGKEAIEFIQEFFQCNSRIHGTGGLHLYNDYDKWLHKLEEDLKLSDITDDRVPSSTYFCVRTSDNRIVGIINIRHNTNKSVLMEIGHVGYSVRPSERSKGYGTRILKLALEKCRELNLNRVLLICDKDNTASAKVIQNN